MIVIELPWPNSANTHWRTAGRVHYISSAGIAFRAGVAMAHKLHRQIAPAGRLTVSVSLYPPNRRVVDIDNRIKPLLDAMQHAGIIENDSLIDKLIVERMSIVKGGKCRVYIGEYGNDDA